MAATATRTGLRKRESSTVMLLMHRNALISRATKRQRIANQRPECVSSTNTNANTTGKKDDEAEDAPEDTSESSESDSDEDYVEQRRQRSTRLRTAAAVARTHTVAVKSTNERALTFLQNARELKIPVRSGKWNEDEENYLRRLVQHFVAGVLDNVEQKMSMRSWLAKMLNCCPMRISKKQMHGERFKGKCKYIRDAERIERITQKDYDKWRREIRLLRFKFLKSWAKEEFSRWSSSEHFANFDAWYTNVLKNVPKPTIATSSRLKRAAETEEEDSWVSIHQSLMEELKMAREAKVKANSILSGHHVSYSDEQSHSYSTDLSVQGQLINLDFAADVDFLEPAVSPELEVEMEVGTFGWELSKSTSSKPPVADDDEEVGQPSPSSSPTLVLDFGPPSRWNADPSAIDPTSPGYCDWADDYIGEDMLLAFDPAMATPLDVSSSHWFQQICTTFQLS